MQTAATYPETGKPASDTKELIMCYRVRADTQKDVSKLSSRKEESAFTPKEDIDARKATPLMPASGFAALVYKLLVPSGKDEGGVETRKDFEMKPSAVKREVEKEID